MTHLEPGIHDGVDSATYHADDLAAEPTLSSSIAKVLLDQSPRHAFHRHPRLGGMYEPDTSRAAELGTVAHAMLTGRGGLVSVIEAENYQTKAAREARASALAHGRCPILQPDHDTAEAMVRAAREQLREIHGASHAFKQGRAEAVLLWRDEIGPMCRGMVDWTNQSLTEIWDYKTSSVSIAPQSLGRRIVDMGYDLQAGFYERGVTQLFPDIAGRLRFRWLFQETEPPYQILVAELDAAGREIGRRKAVAAMTIWQRCMEANDWPGYPQEIVRAEMASFHMVQWEHREMEDPALAGVDYSPGATFQRTPALPSEIIP